MKLDSKTISLRLIECNDAEFVVSLRVDEKYNKFLSPVSADVEAQREWIANYKQDEQAGRQYYFIIERTDGVRCGTVRVYDLREDSFSWGSWILNEEKPRYAALETAFLVYRFGFETLRFPKCHFEVIKQNQKVTSFHEKMGAVRVSEDDANYYYEMTAETVKEAYVRFSKFISA